MIIKLDRSYHSQLIRYLKAEADFNIFTLGDIDTYGYNSNFFNIWAQIDSLGQFRGVLVKYYDTLIFYSRDKYNVFEFSNLINELYYNEISGKEDTLQKLEPYLDFSRKRVVNFSILNQVEMLRGYKDDINVKPIRFGKIRKVAKLYEAIDEFEKPTIQSIKIGLKSGRGYCIEINKKVVAMAKSTLETKTHAMLVGVGTHPDFRNRGLATKCIVKICKDIINENKIPCLFYDNIEAGKIYNKLGFKEKGYWAIYSR
jgi:predicted GNAT family acetyltransferase